MTPLMDYPSRRRFIKGASACLGAGSLAALFPNTARAVTPNNRDGKLGIALVGLGNYSTRQLAPALELTSECYLAGIVTGTKEKEAVWKEERGIKESNIYNYDNFDAISNNEEIDIVYVVLPNSMHAEYTIRAAEAGKHVICEKPMAIDVEEAEAMIEACDRAKVQLSIGYRLHFDPNTCEIMKLADEKPYGNIKYVQSEASFIMGRSNQWRLQRALAGGGAVMDMGIYAIQAARYATGEEPIAIRAQEYKTDWDKFREVDETVTWQLEFPSGAYASSMTSYNARANRLFVSYEKGQAQLEPATRYTGIKGTIQDRALPVQAVNQQARQMDGFARGIRDGRPSIVPGEEGLRDMKVIAALYQSIQEGGARIPMDI